MRRIAAVAAFVCALAGAAWAQERRVDYLEVEGPVTPVVAGYLERAISEAARDDAALVLLRLDTPGGSTDVMKRVSQTITGSPVPVAVWVAPKGAMAASAGTFVVLSAHAAVMAPGTSIGAASPVGEQGQDLGETAERKAKNVLVTQIRNLAERRGPAAEDWAERAVRDAAAATAEEALELRVVDAIAATREEVLARLDGHIVPLGADSVPLRTAGAAFRDVPMTAVESFLHTISNPSIAFILLVLGMNGLLFELSSPGIGVAGVVGGICLLLGFYALGVLPVNYAGLFLIALAFVLFLVDVKAATHGVLTIGGILALVFGAMILFDSPVFAVAREVILFVAAATGGFFAFVVAAAVRAQMRPAVTGSEGLVGRRGIARSALAPAGTVLVEGEIWSARAEGGPVDAGAPVEVVGIEGLELRVRGG